MKILNNKFKKKIIRFKQSVQFTWNVFHMKYKAMELSR